MAVLVSLVDSCGFTPGGTNRARVTLFQDVAMLKYMAPYRYLVYKGFGHPAPPGNLISLSCVNIWSMITSSCNWTLGTRASTLG